MRAMHYWMTAVLALVLCLVQTMPVLADDTRVVTTLTSAEMEILLKEEGFVGVEIDEDDDLIVKMMGYRVIVFVRGNDYSRVQFRFSVGGTKATLSDMNEWNRLRLFTKAYLDEDDDPVLEMDVDLEGGVTLARVKDSIKTFNVSLGAFLQELSE